MLFPRIFFFFLFSFFLSIQCLAENKEAIVAEFQKKALERQLSHQNAWYRQLHFDDTSESFVDDDHFFLHADGKDNAEAELLKNIEQFIVNPQLQCQFPWRSRWISLQLDGYKEYLDAVNCQEYDDWRKKLNAHSATLVLAASFLNSPSSMYGHTFLRFDTEGQEKGKDLTSYAVNFGARLEGDGGFLYAYNGLFGGYPGYFADGPYFTKVKEYSRFDNRDIWEYHLNLSPEETDILLAHLWELNNIKFDYYFFDENCSFRLLELLEVARDGVRLTDNFDVYATPIDTVRKTEQEGLIESVSYRPSNRSKLEFNIDQLSSDEQHIARDLAYDKAVWLTPEVQAMTDAKRYKIAEVAYQYLRYLNNRQQRNQKIASHSLFLLKKVKQYAEYAKEETPETPPRPERGHDTRAWTLTAGQEDLDNTAFTDIEFRAAYHDLLDNLLGYPLATELMMSRIKLRYKEDGHIKLQSLGLAEISSLSRRTLFFKPTSWRVRAGLDREWTKGEEELIGRFDGGGGWTVPVVGAMDAYLLAQARIEYNGGFDQPLDVAAGYTTGFLMQHVDSSFILEAQQYWFTDGVERRQIQAAYQLPLSKNHALRLHFKRIQNDDDDVREASLAYRFYY